MRAHLFAGLLATVSAPDGLAAVFYHDESIAGDLSDDYLSPTVFTPGAGSSVLKGTVITGAPDLFTLVVAADLRIDSIILLNYTTDSENPENLSYLMSQPRATLSAPPSSDFAEAIGYVGFGEWAEGRNVLRIMTAGPPYDYAATLGPGTYAFWVNETGPTSGYEFQFNLSAIPEPGAFFLVCAGLPLLLRRKRRKS